MTIKFGNTLTTICINRKENNVRVKTNSDREVQTDENVKELCKRSTTSGPITKNKLQNTNIINYVQKAKLADIKSPTQKIQTLDKSSTVEKSTASADTLTNEDNKKFSSNKLGTNYKCQTKSHKPGLKSLEGISEDFFNIFDISDNESHKSSENTPSAILMNSIFNRVKSRKYKRDKEAVDSDELPMNKKIKLTHNNNNDKSVIDHLIEPVHATYNKNCNNNNISPLTDVLPVKQGNNCNKDNNKQQYTNKQFSKNIFSMQEKDSEILELSKSKKYVFFKKNKSSNSKQLSSKNQIKQLQEARNIIDDDTEGYFDVFSLSDTSNKNHQRGVKLCVGGSRLSSSERVDLKFLCLQRNWTYVEKYSKDLTHLVVGVDEENKSRRSITFMCALAAAKWIVSYEWVVKCLETNNIVNEEPFEALDISGEPGPRRSRIAKKKLFQGITFYCMPPFSKLDVDILKELVQSAGGRVAAAFSEAGAGRAPVLLLAERNRRIDYEFEYLAMAFNIVPVNYEWVLNCLGSYTLRSIYQSLLCSASLLPAVTSNWLSELIRREFK